MKSGEEFYGWLLDNVGLGLGSRFSELMLGYPRPKGVGWIPLVDIQSVMCGSISREDPEVVNSIPLYTMYIFIIKP